ncbi:c-type cytochrome [bacterium]|nr:c-type cytochrome [bacterium]
MSKALSTILFLAILTTSLFAEEPKNIKLLKGMSYDEIKLFMKQVSTGLGVKCQECHNTKNFSSDEKEDKKIALEMMKMVQGLNANVFNYKDAPKITCYTCHAGNKKTTNEPPKKQ